MASQRHQVANLNPLRARTHQVGAHQGDNTVAMHWANSQYHA